MAEVFFYHLDQKPLKSVLPELVGLGLKRGLRMVIEAPAAEALPQLSEMLWAVEDVSFLVHGFGEDAHEKQPLCLCADAANPNAASYRFYVEGAMPQSIEGLARALILFEGNDEEALASARSEWKKRKAEGHTISYWKQDENGKWQNLA